jgi:myosin-5
MAHNYDVGTKAWQPDATEGWVASEVVSKTENEGKVTLVFELVNGEVSSPPFPRWNISLLDMIWPGG